MLVWLCLNDDDDVSRPLSQKQKHQRKGYRESIKVESLEDFYDKYNH